MCLAIVAVLLTGCGGGADETETVERPSEPQPFYIALDGYSGAENVGVLMARKMGYFEEVALDVSATTPASPGRPVLYAAANSVDLSISHLPQVVLSREKGVPIRAIGSVISQPTAAMIWLKKSGIDDIADLKGKTIAIPGVPFQRELLQSVLAEAGLTLGDVKVRRVEYQLVPSLVSGRADAIFGGSGNVEGAELESRGLDPVVTPVTELGVPPYDELVVIVSQKRLAEDPQSIRDFMAAMERGTAAAIENPKGAVEAIEEAFEADPRLGRKATEAEVEATLPLLSTTGEMDPQAAEDLVAWMHEQGMIQREPPVSSLLDNDYLPES